VIAVEIFRRDLVCVVETPSLAARIVFRAESTERFACRVSGLDGWRWDYGSARVPADVAAAIDRAVVEAQWRHHASSGVAPPSSG